MSKRKKNKYHHLLTFLEDSLEDFPNDEEREEIVNSLEVTIDHLRGLQKQIESIPNDKKREEVLSAVKLIEGFLISAEGNSKLATILGMPPTKGRKLKTKTEISSRRGEGMLKELECMPTKEIEQRLMGYPVNDLRSLATHLSIKSDRMKKEDLVDKITKLGFANVRGYDILRGKSKEK